MKRYFKLAKEITQESSLYVTGTITEDNRSDLGYEMQVKSIEVISEAHDYPITPQKSWYGILNGSLRHFMVTF